MVSFSDTAIQHVDHHSFSSAVPFPLLVVDDFLPVATADAIFSEVTRNDDLRKSNDYIFAKNKFENPDLEAIGSATRAFRNLMLSDEVAAFLSDLYGKTVFVDPEFVGGGLHRGGQGSFLDMHVDFGLHPKNRLWIRELNILFYLNKHWDPSFGGNLELRNGRTGKTLSVEARFNRLVIMLTKDFTFHGYRPIRFPPGTFRTSIAAYAYSQAMGTQDTEHLRTTTVWLPEGGGILKAAVARATPALVTLKQRLFGSSTARKK